MLFRQALNDEFVRRSDAFREFMLGYAAEIEVYLSALGKISQATPEQISQISNGAIPSAEIFDSQAFSMPFGTAWNNHEQARAWSDEILERRPTFAADGSQIYSAKETSPPIAAVQIGWFENSHDISEPYEKNARFEILTPDELFRGQDNPMNPDVRVEERRYLGEADAVGNFLKKKRGWQKRGERMPIAFFDNPLLVPFSQQGLQKSFLDANIDLVRLSAETRVPLVGFVDRSFSRDIVTMLDSFVANTRSNTNAVYDASILNARNSDRDRSLDAWGDRTCFCYSQRRGLEAFIDDATGRSSVGFAYLRTTEESVARLDIPSWIYEAGWLNEVVDVVRAECVIGLGYPYALETADAASVISSRDREVFLRALQEFANRGKLNFSVARKDASKGRRRN
ncbi:MAG: DNA double-strand break repair nuclease NurA [Pyrinomonadaceae bacterium]